MSNENRDELGRFASEGDSVEFKIPNGTRVGKVRKVVGDNADIVAADFGGDKVYNVNKSAVIKNYGQPKPPVVRAAAQVVQGRAAAEKYKVTKTNTNSGMKRLLSDRKRLHGF